MANRLIVGMQWGDEGKGKIIDQLSPETDYVVRFQGGSNAGHTVVIGETEIVLHLMPSGIMHKNKVCVIGNGVVLDPAQLLVEIADVRSKNFDVTPENFKLSDRTHIVFPYHKLADGIREDKRGADKLGTTKRGIGPCYGDKTSRLGLRVCDMYQEDYFRRRVTENVALYNELYFIPAGHGPVEAEGIIDAYLACAKELKPYVCDTIIDINKASRAGKNILLESAQGVMLDIDFGTYPYVTSSSSSGAAMFAGCGLSLGKLDECIGILKAYTTRVGTGPFPTELHDEMGEKLRSEGGEFGATTGRPRRCGWLDMVVARYTGMVSGVTSIALTKLDVLCTHETIKVCTAYNIDGKEVTDFPAFITADMDFKPVYTEFAGWMEDISGIKDYNDLPANARAYVEAIEDLGGIPVSMISTGRRRGEIIFK